MLTVVVGTGYTGGRILRRISDAAAIGLSRSIPDATDDCSISILDLDRNSGLPVELPGDYALIYTVPPAGDPHVDERLSGLLDRLKPMPRRFVYISTTGVYGNCNGALVDEKAEPRPGSSRSEHRLTAERLLQQRCKLLGIDLVILRVPGIYGPGRTGIESIRDVIAFPKNNSGRDMMIDTPSTISGEQLDELSLKVDLKE
jgi:hypothetical protein